MSSIETIKKIGDYFPYCLTIVDIEEPTRPCLYANTKFLENTGYQAEEATGRNLSYLQGPLTAEDTISFMRETFQKKEACIQDIINYKKDGTPFLNRLLMVPLKDGEKTFYIGFQNDITKQKGLDYKEDSLRKVNEGEIRHMVNNPLTIILGLLSLRLKKGIDSSKEEVVTKQIQDLFNRIISYALDVESISNFENFDQYHADAKKILAA